MFPWNNYTGFAPNVIAKSLELEGMVISDSGLIVLDRSLIDTVAYARLNDCEYLLPELYVHIKNAGYGQAFFCDFVGSYKNDQVRMESFKEARETQEALSVAYNESGIEIINMPVASIEERVKIFENVCGISNR